VNFTASEEQRKYGSALLIDLHHSFYGQSIPEMPFEKRKKRKSRRASSLRSHTPVTLPLIIIFAS
jgi:hypothetical protein